MRSSALGLDVRLRYETVASLARHLMGWRVPILIVSGERRDRLPAGIVDAPFLAKPFLDHTLARLALVVFGEPSG